MTQVRHRVHLTEEELAELKRLRAARRERRAEPELSVGQRVADLVAATMGSWPVASAKPSDQPPAPAKRSTAFTRPSWRPS